MKSNLPRIPLLAVLFCLAATNTWAIDPDLGRFSDAKQKQIRDLAETITHEVPADVWRFYDAMRVDDWDTATNLYFLMKQSSHTFVDLTNHEAVTPALATLLWQPISESYGAYENFHDWNNRWLHRYGDAIINSIPPGSIYFGGTDPGRFVISMLCESQIDGRPFFTLTQNQLGDKPYLDYLQAMYGKKMYVPTAWDMRQAIKDYAADFKKRSQTGKLMSGENVRTVNGEIKISSQISVMQVNGLIARAVFDQNPEREFYVEESFPLDWMYPYLSTHGLIFKLNREKQMQLPEAEVATDHDYWKKLTDEELGNWLDDQTSLQTVCDFALKYGLGKQLDDYKGDKEFAANDLARKCYSKLRCSQGGLYAWRADHALDADERARMNRAAELAYKQAYALCPYSPEAVFRYASLLTTRHRVDDCILILKTSAALAPDNLQFKDTLDRTMKLKDQ